MDVHTYVYVDEAAPEGDATVAVVEILEAILDSVAEARMNKLVV